MKKMNVLIRVVLAAVFVGLTISLFQYITELVLELGKYLASSNVTMLILFIVIGLLLYFCLYYVNKYNKGYYGSGIPQFEAYYDGLIMINPIKMLILIFINSIYSFFVGLPLGGEGPSITISSSIGLTINRLFNVNDDEIVAGCGSAGFACAFSNPVAGLCHLLEENKNKISISFILKGVAIMLIAYVINYFILDETLLPYFDLTKMPVKYYLYLLLIVALVLIFARTYSLSIIWIKSLSKNNKLMVYLTPALIIFFILLKRFMPFLTGSGLGALSLDILDYALITILGFLVFRVIVTALAVSSLASGGIVLPMVCMGGLIGLFVVKFVSKFDDSILDYSAIFMLVGMFSFLAVLTRCPFTALALGLGCGSFSAIAIPLILTIFITFGISHFLKYRSIYHDLKDLLIKSNTCNIG